MSHPRLRYLLDCRLRANPDLVIVPFERMSPAEMAVLGEVRLDGDYVGIIRARDGSDATVSAVCKNTASLFSDLSTPGSVPASFRNGPEDDVNRQIANLVLSGILELDSDGDFVSGVRARKLVHALEEEVENRGRIAQLSLAAIRFGQRLPLDDANRLSAQMYFYNRTPIAPAWAKKLADERDYCRYLGLSDGPCAGLLEAHWNELSTDRTAWRYWSCKEAVSHASAKRSRCKLYVSPTLEAIGDTFCEIVQVFTEEKTPRFKIGADLAGLARPDKIVAYFDEFHHMESVGRALTERLVTTPVQGVPFTGDLGADGLVSWGIDPDDQPVVARQASASWRIWITNHLAVALLAARKAPDLEIEPWQFALERLRLLGVDTDSWTPTSAYEGESSNRER